MENPTKAITITLTIITAIAATSMIESRLAIRKSLRQSSGGIDLRQASEFRPEPSDPGPRNASEQSTPVVLIGLLPPHRTVP